VGQEHIWACTQGVAQVETRARAAIVRPAADGSNSCGAQDQGENSGTEPYRRNNVEATFQNFVAFLQVIEILGFFTSELAEGGGETGLLD